MLIDVLLKDRDGPEMPFEVEIALRLHNLARDLCRIYQSQLRAWN